MECVHKLLSTTYFRFAASNAKGSLRRALLSSALWSVAYDPDQQAPSLHFDVIADVHGAPAPLANEEMLDETLGDATEHGLGSGDWARVNSKRRRAGCEWLATNPLGQLMLQRLLMEPLRVYLKAQLTRAGSEWEHGQQAQVAAAELRGFATVRTREYRPTLVASGADDNRFHHQVSMLFSVDEMWQTFPPRWKTVGNRSLAFRCLSRMACAQWQMLGSDHLRFPLQMFRLLDDPSLAEEFIRVPDCLLDDWSKSLKSDYPTLSGTEFDVVLATTAIGYMVDISAIEAKHAAIRRTLLAASLQTHQMSAQNLSARW